MMIPSNSKVQVLGNCVVVAATGAVGFTQRLIHHVDSAIIGGVFKATLHECKTNISRRLLTDFETNKVQIHPQAGLRFGALIAAAIKDAPCLIEYSTTDFQPEVKEGNLYYVAMGSGQVLAEPFLAFVSRVLWRGTMPTVKVGRFGVHWVLDHTLKLAPGGVGGPIHIAILEKKDGRWAASEIPDLQEHEEYITELESHIGSFAK